MAARSISTSPNGGMDLNLGRTINLHTPDGITRTQERRLRGDGLSACVSLRRNRVVGRTMSAKILLRCDLLHTYHVVGPVKVFLCVLG